MKYPTAEELDATIIREAEAVLYAEGNHHVDEWQTPKPYLGISTLTKQPATTYAKKLITQTSDDVHPWWGSLGNWLCQQAMQPVTDHRECQTRVDLGDYDRIGHFDGCTFRDEAGNAVGIKDPDVHYATIEEGKAHATVQEFDAIELAYRQGGGYAVDIETQIEQGRDAFPLAPFHKPRWDPWAKPIEKWPNGVEIQGVNVWVFPRFGPGSITDEHRQIKPFNLGPAEKADIREWLDAKTKAVRASWVEGSEDAALAYERSPAGLTEFARSIHEPPVVADEEAAQVASAWRDAKQAAKAAKKVVEGKEQAQLKAILASQGRVSEDEKKVSARIGDCLVEARWPSLTHLSIK